MRHLGLCLLSVVFVASCDSQLKPPDYCENNPDDEQCKELLIDLLPARIYLDPPFGIGFDCVQVGCETTRLVTIENRGERDLHITLARLSVDTSTEFSFSLHEGDTPTLSAPLSKPTVDNPLIIPPTETRQVAVTYAPRDAQEDAGALWLDWHDGLESYDDAVQERAELPITTRVLGEAEATIESGALNFGYVPLGTPKTVPVVVTNTSNGSATLEIQPPTFSPGSSPAFFTTQTEPVYVNSGESAEIEVTFVPDAATAFEGELVLGTNDGARPTIHIRLLGTSIADPYFVFVEPEDWVVQFGDVRIGDVIEREVTIKNLGGLPLLVTPNLADESTGFAMAVASGVQLPALNPLAEYTFTVTLNPTVGGALWSEIDFTTNDPTLPDDWVDMVGYGVAPDAAIAPDNLDFGQLVQFWTSEAQTVTVSNQGTGDMTVTALTFEVGSSPQVKLVSPPPLPVKLGPDETMDFSVYVEGQTIGPAGATLLLHTDSIVDPVRPISVTAEIVSCEVGCAMANGTPSCASGSCAVGTCNTNFHDADENFATGCECPEDAGGDIGGNCAQGRNVGPLGDKCSSYPGNVTRTGTLHSLDDVDLYWFRAYDDSSFPTCDVGGDSFGIRAQFTSAPPGLEFCYRVANAGCGGENQWSCGHTNKLLYNGGYGDDDDTDATVWVRFAPGANPVCGTYTIRFDADDG